MLLLLAAGKNFNLGVAIVWLLVLLVLSIPVGFLIALGLRKWNERHPIEEAEDVKHPLKLND
ncbi:MAG: hypothetical protein ACXVZV_08380 [Terriglobales bacterium]